MEHKNRDSCPFLSLISGNENADTDSITEPFCSCGQEQSLAMVYSPYQHFRLLYEPEQGLSRGTIFKELDMPFEGDGRCV